MLIYKGDKQRSNIELSLNYFSNMDQIRILVNSILVIILCFDVKRHLHSSPLRFGWAALLRHRECIGVLQVAIAHRRIGSFRFFRKLGMRTKLM
jgi:hypothetical protein